MMALLRISKRLFFWGLYLATVTTLWGSTDSCNGTCAREYIVAVASTTTGTRLHISSSAPDDTTLDVPDQYLPTLECRHANKCGVLLIHDQSESELIVFVPVTSGVVMVTYSKGVTPEHTFYAIESDCRPVKAFRSSSEHNRVVVECVNLSSETKGWLMWAEFSLTERKIVRYSEPFLLLSSSTLSEAVQVGSHVFLSDSGDLLLTDTQPSASLRPDLVKHMDNCTLVSHMSVAGNRVFVYCAGEDSWILPDNLHLERTPFHWYPCPGFAGKSVSVHDRNLFYGSRVIGNLEDDIVFGVCIGTVELHFFWGLTNVGQLLSFPLTGDNHTMSNLTACVTSGNDTCLRPFFDDSKFVGAYFDPKTSQIQILNLTGCHGHRTVSLTFVPQLLGLVVGEKVDNCSCIDPRPFPEKQGNTTVVWIIVGCVVGALVIIGLSVLLCCLCLCHYVRRKTVVRCEPTGDSAAFFQAITESGDSTSTVDIVVSANLPHEGNKYSSDSVARIIAGRSGEDSQNRAMEVDRYR